MNVPKAMSAGATVFLSCALVVGCATRDEPMTTNLSASAQAGFLVAKDKGCASCHGSDFAGGVGPSWVGLFGSSRRIVGSDDAVANREYLIESIVDPSAKRVAGFSIGMPKASLSDAEVQNIVDYIEALEG